MDRGIKDLFASNSPRNYFHELAEGLRKPKDSGEYRYAVFQIQRVIVPGFSSVLFLAGLIAMALVFGKEGARSQDVTIPVTVMQVEKIELDKLDVEVKPDESPIVPTDVQQPDTVAIGEVNSAAGAGEGASQGFAGSGELAEPGAVLAPVMTKSPLILRGLYANRGSGGARAAARRAYGGSKAGEDAVLRALRWLKKNQDENGAWAKADGTHPPAMAGLALLAFLAHGETPASQEFGSTVEKAMKYLLSVQTAKGLFGNGGNAFGHGIDSYAISEAYALTKIVSLKDAMEKGLQIIIDGQQVPGGFNYNYAKDDRFDLSVAGWQFQAMKAAKMAGASNPGLDAAIAKGISFLERNAFANAGDSSGFVYCGKPGVPPAGGARPSMTGAGTLCLQLLGKGNSPCVSAGIQFLERVQPQWPSGREMDSKGKPIKVPVYTWYYVTQAKFQKGGKVWDAWNPVFSRELIANQQSDGHWENGDWGGPVYTTCLCTLMLEVYYRYLPSYHKQEDKSDAPEKVSDEPAIQISA